MVVRADASRNRVQIVDAARDLLVRDGADLRMEELARAANVAVGTLYRHFPTKSDLIDTVVSHSLTDVADRAEEAVAAVAGGGSAWDLLRDLLGTIADGRSARLAVLQTAALLGFRLADISGGASGDAPAPPRVAPAAHADAVRAGIALEALVRAAQSAGEMRTDVGLGDLFLLLSRAPERRFEAERERYLELVSDGLRPARAKRTVGQPRQKRSRRSASTAP